MHEKRSLPICLTLFCLMTLLSACNFPDVVRVECSVTDLIDTIDDANAAADYDILELSPECDYVLSSVNNTHEGANGLPLISTPMTIRGNNATIRRDPSAADFRIFAISDTGNLEIYDLVVENGSANGVDEEGDGGGFYNEGRLRLINSLLRENSAGGSGGAAGGGQPRWAACRKRYRQQHIRGAAC